MKKFDFDNPVTILTGNEFLPKEGITFAEQILHFFQSQGGVAHSPWGEVLLDKKGIQSDKSHGVGRINDWYDGRSHSHRNRLFYLCCSDYIQSERETTVPSRNLLDRKNPGDCCI